MSSGGIFVVGTLITLVVFTALGILAYGIMLDRRDLLAADHDRLAAEPEATQPPSQPGADRRAATALVLK